MVNDMQVVVTGASGFIAKNVRKHLSDNNVKLISISRKDFKKFKNETKIITKNYDEKTILPKLKNSYALIHLVGIGKQTVDNDYNLIHIELTKKIINTNSATTQADIIMGGFAQKMKRVKCHLCLPTHWPGRLLQNIFLR